MVAGNMSVRSRYCDDTLDTDEDGDQSGDDVTDDTKTSFSLPPLSTTLQMQMDKADRMEGRHKKPSVESNIKEMNQLTMRELHGKLNDLRSENFNLKLRIYEMEKATGVTYQSDAKTEKETKNAGHTINGCLDDMDDHGGLVVPWLHEKNDVPTPSEDVVDRVDQSSECQRDAVIAMLMKRCEDEDQRRRRELAEKDSLIAKLRKECDETVNQKEVELQQLRRAITRQLKKTDKLLKKAKTNLG